MMNTTFQKKMAAFVISVASMSMASAYADEMDDHAAYCKASGGVVEKMPVEISAGKLWVKGQSKMFCNFNVDDGFISIGLETFSSYEPSIAATYIKTLGEISETSSLWKGNYTNPSSNVCKNLGGASIGFISSGGFTNQLGQNDICVFGDASMVSAWSLIYMANHRSGYDDVKNKVNATPLNIPVPK